MLVREIRTTLENGQLSATLLVYTPMGSASRRPLSELIDMYVLPQNVMASLTAPNGPERTRRRQGAAILPLGVVTVDQEPTEELQADPMAADPVDRAPSSARMRAILILSLISWMMVAFAIAWAIGIL